MRGQFMQYNCSITKHLTCDNEKSLCTYLEQQLIRVTASSVNNNNFCKISQSLSQDVWKWMVPGGYRWKILRVERRYSLGYTHSFTLSQHNGQLLLLRSQFHHGRRWRGARGRSSPHFFEKDFWGPCRSSKRPLFTFKKEAIQPFLQSKWSIKRPPDVSME